MEDVTLLVLLPVKGTRVCLSSSILRQQEQQPNKQKKKEKEQHQMCFLIEQKQTVLHGTVKESLDISMKL